MKDRKKIGARVTQLRNKLSLTEKKFSKRINVSITDLCEVEQGKSKPSCDFLENLSRELNVNLYWLLFGEGEMFFDPAIFLMNGQLKNENISTKEIRDFLWYYQRSPMIQHSTMAHYYTILVQQKENIEREVQEYEEKY
jgi:transcriptional regulator with XRE-family HTH domain